ncbi:LysR family transcriptional regulator [Oxalicibacterium faecigallinarum]|uniref:LysR family transcriptional regulator n=1 Tax=Oxalicibacterium faecigallinarum TaxID=573741 RepID=A0A8J3AT58_9BURK|nr:LysR family transcriptional regulator [Oxalicibacterium faecigallinarum]GGI21654.1 LysR family transcriptional regulator [Oxalicibacterium faecigallinarum]
MDLRQLRYFMAIVEEGQISRAARRLHMAQPPLSLQLKTLEEELGVQLIERNNKSLRLTEAGHALYQRAEQILGLVNATSKEIREFDQGLRGTLGIGSPPGIGHLTMPPRIAAFHKRYPEVTFQWREGNTFRVLELLNTHVIEAGIVRLPVDDNLYAIKPLVTEPWVAVIRASDDDARPASIALAELARQPLLLMQRQQGIFWHDMVWDALRAAEVEPTVFCESDNVMALLTLVELGLGAAIVPRSAAALKSGPQLHTMEISDATLESDVAIIWLKNQRLSAAAKAFLEMF